MTTGHRRIDVHSTAMAPCGSHDLTHVVQDAGLVVGHLATDERPFILGEERLEMREIKVSLVVDLQLEECSIASGARLNGRTLSASMDDWTALAKRCNGGRDRLGDRRGEDDLARRGAGETRHLLSGLFDQVPDHEGFFVGAAGISLRDLKDLVEGFEDGGPKRGDRCVIEIGAH